MAETDSLLVNVKTPPRHLINDWFQIRDRMGVCFVFRTGLLYRQKAETDTSLVNVKGRPLSQDLFKSLFKLTTQTSVWIGSGLLSIYAKKAETDISRFNVKAGPRDLYVKCVRTVSSEGSRESVSEKSTEMYHLGLWSTDMLETRSVWIGSGLPSYISQKAETDIICQRENTTSACTQATFAFCGFEFRPLRFSQPLSLHFVVTLRAITCTLFLRHF